MSITRISGGDAIVASWGDAVAIQLNRIILPSVSATVTTTSTSYSTITGLSWAVEAGKNYAINLTLLYSTAGTSTGIAFGWHLTTATGSAVINADFTSASNVDFNANVQILSADDTGTATTTTAAGFHVCRYQGIYQCTLAGTFSVRFKRGGTSTTVTISAGSGGTVIADS